MATHSIQSLLKMILAGTLRSIENGAGPRRADSVTASCIGNLGTCS